MSSGRLGLVQVIRNRVEVERVDRWDGSRRSIIPACGTVVTQAHSQKSKATPHEHEGPENSMRGCKPMPAKRYHFVADGGRWLPPR